MDGYSGLIVACSSSDLHFCSRTLQQVTSNRSPIETCSGTIWHNLQLTVLLEGAGLVAGQYGSGILDIPGPYLTDSLNEDLQRRPRREMDGPFVGSGRFMAYDYVPLRT